MEGQAEVIENEPQSTALQTALRPAPPTDPRIESFNYIQRVAAPMAISGLFGATKEQAIAKMMVGEALAIHPAVAMQQIHIFDGKVSVAAVLMLSLARQRGWRYKIVRSDATGCVIEWSDPSGVVAGQSSFLEEDAKRVKFPPKDGKERTLLDKDNWRNYPSDMYFARAASRGIRRFAPEVTNGISVYTPEEVEDITPESKPEVRMPERVSATPGAAA